MTGRLVPPFVAYGYEHPDHPTEVAQYQIRAAVVDDPNRSKHIWARFGHKDWRLASDGKCETALAGRLLYHLSGLREAIRDQVPYVAWCEGEKDALAIGDLLAEAGADWYSDPLRPHLGFGPATSHPFGAGKATAGQAAHFRGYRGIVLVGVDDDDAGAMCALLRYRLLRAENVRAGLVRATDAVGGGLGNGVDLADHVAGGYGLGDLVRIRPRDLVPAAQRCAARQATGWTYSPSLPPEEAEWVRQCMARGGVKFRHSVEFAQ